MSRKQMVGGLLGAVVSLFGCTAKPEEPQIVERTEIDGDRILIAYYSWGGNTRAAAEALQTLTDGTLLELRPATPYPDSYLKCVAQAKGEGGERKKGKADRADRGRGGDGFKERRGKEGRRKKEEKRGEKPHKRKFYEDVPRNKKRRR